MDLTGLIEITGESGALALIGLVVGLGFGAFAERSQFCLRSAVIEFTHGHLGTKVAIWAIAFSAAVAITQGSITFGHLDITEARQISARGSVSGALIGGLLFGIGMILARGCASRLLVLSATGNLRALLSGMVLTIIAQASLRGILSPAREKLASLWTVPGGHARDLLALLNLGSPAGFALGLIWLAAGGWIAWRNRVAIWGWAGAFGVGAMVAAGWILTYALSRQSFDIVAIQSVSFTGPSADTLMGFIDSPTLPLGFGIGLIPGVFAGSFLAALLAGDFKLQGFHGGPSMIRYIIGATLMGFGAMLAGGCAVGAGVTGGAIFALTGWLALAAMWAGAAATDYLLDRSAALPHSEPAAAASGK